MKPSRPWPKPTRAQVALLILCVAVVAHQLVFWDWFIEDAAISFAYARNIVAGEGLVPFAGGERVEGYSNPTWVLVMVLPHLLGLDAFLFAKLVQIIFALSTTLLVYATVRDADPDRAGTTRGIIAAAFLAASSQFALWGAAGLEGALLNFLIALAIRRMGIELARGGTPWSALVWLLVALTRPEGIMYAAVGGFCAMIGQRSLRATALWLGLFFVPWGLYQWWHYQYFAWPLPNTYYGKMEERVPNRMAWSVKGWKWIRDFFHNLGYGYFLPIWVLGGLQESRWHAVQATVLVSIVGSTITLCGDQRLLLVVWLWCLWAGFALSVRASIEPGQPAPVKLIAVGTALTILLVGISEAARALGHAPAVIPVPTLVNSAPPYVLTAAAMLIPFAASEPARRLQQLRILAWMLCCTVLFFAIYVQNDWMKGFRWMSVAAVPGAVLFALGTDGFIRFLRSLTQDSPDSAKWPLWGYPVALVIVIAMIPANIVSSRDIAMRPDASPQQIKLRVDYIEKIRQRVHLEERLVDLDVDQGAHLYWSSFEMMDFAGLVDVPFAHNHYERAFVREYLFEERRPHIAHVHGSWAQRTKIPTHPEWKRGYVELPPYPTGRRSWHPGNFIRRDLFLDEVRSTDPALARFDNGLELQTLSIPSPPGEKHKMYVQIALSFQNDSPRQDFRLILFASGEGRIASWELPPGYDWVAPSQWREGERFVGKFDLTLPPQLVEGRYALGVVVVSSRGEIVPRTNDGHPEPAPRAPAPVFAEGEALLPMTLEVLSVEARGTAAKEDRKEAQARASALDCEGAEESWRLARYHRVGEPEWREEHEPAIREALAACWARSADGASQDEQIRRLILARNWDHHNPDYLSRAHALSARLTEAGQDAREGGRQREAYTLLSNAVEVDRSNAWARRWAEEERAKR